MSYGRGNGWSLYLFFIIIIDEYNRAKLSFIRATDGSDYINASYVDVSVQYVDVHMYMNLSLSLCVYRVIGNRMHS